jgi:hypothetical protein
MDYNELFDRLWGFDGVHPFGDPFKFEEYMETNSDEELETETCEFVKGDFKTVITCKFNSKGFMVGHSILSTHIGDDTDLEGLMQKALDNEDYILAAGIKRRIDASKSGE